MLFRTDVTGTRPVTQTDSGTTITSVTSASQEALNRLALISVGKQFQAQIMSRLNDGTFLVRVADSTARMALPDTAKTGDTITLTLLSPSPRPTFVLGENSSAVEQTIANLLQDTAGTAQVTKNAATAASATAALAEQIPGSATASLSSAGRLVDNLLHAAQLDGASTKILGQTPILSSPNVSAESMAQALRNTLEYSGLFYESHMAQWVGGRKTLEELMREPQAQTSGQVDSGNLKNGHSLIDMMRALEAAQQSRTDTAGNLAQLATMNNETARLINLQLSALEQRRIAWQGELWPGHRFEWEVSEDTPGQGSPEQEQTWRSTVRFEMPTLGTITASIHLANGHVQMHVRTTSDEAATRLQANGDKLASALDAAGSPLDLLTVKRNEPA